MSKQKQLNYESIGATYKKECPYKDRHINSLVLPLLYLAGDSREKCKTCGNPLWTNKELELLPDILEAITGISMEDVLNRKFHVLSRKEKT